MMEPHQVFRTIREKSGYTQVELARKLKVKQVAISYYENKCKRLPFKIALAMEKIAQKNKLNYKYEDLRP